MANYVTIREGHSNFFTPIRFILAYMVLIGHSFVVYYGGDQFEPDIFFNLTSSYVAVNMFFITSGFLVTSSMLYRKDAAGFASARFLRIYPALIVHVLFMMFIFGPLTTSIPLGQYFTDKHTLLQPIEVLSFKETEMNLPGILQGNFEQIGSATLWTLRYEVLAYVGTLAAFSLGFMGKRWMLLAQFVVCAIAAMLVAGLDVADELPATIDLILRFGVCYGLGATIYGYRDQLKFHWVGIPVIIGLTTLTYGSVVFEVMSVLMLGYILFFFAYIKIPYLNFLKKINDISYGLYIYHWATLQGIRHFWPDVSILQLIAIGSPIAITLACISWHFVESPALRLTDGLADILKRKKTALALSHKAQS